MEERLELGDVARSAIFPRGGARTAHPHGKARTTTLPPRWRQMARAVDPGAARARYGLPHTSQLVRGAAAVDVTHEIHSPILLARQVRNGEADRTVAQDESAQ